jgi:hypothetical protein
VRDAAGQLSDGFHHLRLSQALFEHLRVRDVQYVRNNEILALFIVHHDE